MTSGLTSWSGPSQFILSGEGRELPGITRFPCSPDPLGRLTNLILLTDLRPRGWGGVLVLEETRLHWGGGTESRGRL